MRLTTIQSMPGRPCVLAWRADIGDTVYVHSRRLSNGTITIAAARVTDASWVTNQTLFYSFGTQIVGPDWLDALNVQFPRSGDLVTNWILGPNHQSGYRTCRNLADLRESLLLAKQERPEINRAKVFMGLMPHHEGDVRVMLSSLDIEVAHMDLTRQRTAFRSYHSGTASISSWTVVGGSGMNLAF